MRREESMRESAEAHLNHWAARVAASPAGSLAAFEARMALAIAKYSAGEPLDAVRKALQDAVAELASARTPLPLHEAEHYYPALWALSLSIVFGDASSAFATRMVGQDLLIDRLLQLTDRSISPASKLLHPKAMQHLIAAMDAPKAAVPAVEAFLENWYAAMGPTPWHDTHLRHDPAFFGYWAFELAAVVKALNISDGPFSRHTYYPKEIVHQRTYKPWLDDGKARPKPEAVAEAQQQVQAVRELLQAFFNSGEMDAAGEKSLDDNLKSLGRLFNTGKVESDPEAMRLGFFQLLKSVSAIAEEASHEGTPAQQAEQIAAMREMEQELLSTNPELAKLAEELNKEAGFDPQNTEFQQHITASRSQMSSIHETIESMLQDQSIELEQLFEGIEALHERMQKEMGIEPEKPLDIYKDVSERVGKSLAEANKKNMITEDFDWSSLWRKEEDKH